MQAILDYETLHDIPPGWVNFSISRTAPDGAWHRLERGEIKMDADFFAGFTQDLHHERLWRDFYTRSRKTSEEVGVASATGAESAIPPVPQIDAEWLFWEMMRVSRTPDPWMVPALKKLKASRQFLLGALSNAYIFPDGHPYNERAEDDVRSLFDVFISSAHVGLRKPDPSIYELAVRELDRYATDQASQMGDGLKWVTGVKAQDVVFLDDIGTNLRTAKQLGMRTIRVQLGKSLDAVRELENITGLALIEGGSKAKL